MSQDAVAPGATLRSSTETGKGGQPLQLVPRHGLTRNKSQQDEYVPVAVLAVDRIHDQADWAVTVSIAGKESIVAIPRQHSREEAAEMAWRDVCLAAARLGKGGGGMIGNAVRAAPDSGEEG